jgi:hypothetical protein
MNQIRKKQILLIITLTGILMLLLLNQIENPIIEGKIDSLEKEESLTILKINQTRIIIFEKIEQLEINENVKIFGRKELYKNETQIIAEKIKK